MGLSRVNPETFFKILKDFGELSTEIAVQFPLEYFQEDSFIFLYKTIATKTYATQVFINREMEGIFVLVNGKSITLEEFLNDLIVNRKAIQLLENQNPKLILKQE